MTTKLFYIGFIAISLIWVGDARAQNFNYSRIIIGERPVGMGGASVGLADETSAAYYNPAGLTQIREASTSLSANVYSIQKRKRRFLLNSNEKATSSAYLPPFYGISQATRWGHIGFSVVVNQDNAFNIHRNYQNLSTDIFGAMAGYETVRYDEQLQERTTLLGPSWAKEIFNHFSFGVTAYLAHNTANNSNYTFLDTQTNLLRFEDIEEFSGSGNGLLAKAGILHKPNSQMSWGLTWWSQAAIKESLRQSRLQYWLNDKQSPSRGYRFNFEKDLENTIKEPSGFAGGFSFKTDRKTVYVLDVTHYGAVTSNITSYDLVYTGVDLDGFPASANTVETKTKTIKKAVTNIHAGAEYMFTPQIPFRLGFLTDFSAAPEINNDTSQPQDEHLDNYALTTSVGYLTKNSTLLAGLRLGWGKGEAKVNNRFLTSYQKTTVKAIDLALTLGGTYRF